MREKIIDTFPLWEYNFFFIYMHKSITYVHYFNKKRFYKSYNDFIDK